MTDDGWGIDGRDGGAIDEEPLLEVANLEKHYPVTEGLFERRVGTVRAVDGVSFSIRRGETLGLVGESGCGKSTLATTLLRLEEPTAGSISFDGDEVTDFDDRRLKRFRRDAQLILQDPDSSFDPRMRVGESVTEPLLVHGFSDRRRRRAIGESAIERVGLSATDYDRYPHEFSGGQRQRLALARALVVGPRLLVADEPVSALDVSVQSQILSLLVELQREIGLAVLLVSHDLGLVREVCDRVTVMYAGEIVESGPTEAIFSDPKHPYTRALLSAIPEPDPSRRDETVRLSGRVPDPSEFPSGCRFHPRCPSVIQPDHVDVDQSTWRHLLDARDRISDGGVDVDAVAALAPGEPSDSRDASDPDGVDDVGDPPARSPRRVAAALRVELGLPDPISDDAVERVVKEAISSLIEGDQEEAANVLRSAVWTPCERREPERRTVGPDRDVSCHLHDPPDDVVADDGPGPIGADEFEWLGDRSS